MAQDKPEAELGEAHIFLVKTATGQERNVARIIERRAKAKGEPYSTAIKAILCSEDVKGYIFVEATSPHFVDELIYGLRHVKTRLPGFVPLAEVEKYIAVKPPGEGIEPGNVVEITGGPFRGMQARVISIDRQKGEATIELVEATFTLPITIFVDYLRKLPSPK
ncbi:MAG: transcription elongation factor Spt5 [Candidatus Bathyarchaeia archaeon]